MIERTRRFFAPPRRYVFAPGGANGYCRFVASPSRRQVHTPRRRVRLLPLRRFTFATVLREPMKRFALHRRSVVFTSATVRHARINPRCCIVAPSHTSAAASAHATEARASTAASYSSHRRRRFDTENRERVGDGVAGGEDESEAGLADRLVVGGEHRTLAVEGVERLREVPGVGGDAVWF